MGVGDRRSSVKRLVWIAAGFLAGLITIWVSFMMVQATREERVLNSMAFPISLAATCVRACYPEVRALAQAIRPDFILTDLTYSPRDNEAAFWFKAYGQRYQSEIVALGFSVDTLTWRVTGGRVIYGSRQIDFSESDLELTPLDVVDVLEIAADAGVPRVGPGESRFPVSVSWQAGYWLVSYPDMGIEVAISRHGEVRRVDRRSSGP